MTNEELRFVISGCCRNDRESQRQLYLHYFNEMHNYVTKYVTDPIIVEEVINNGFLRIFTKIHLFTYKGSFAGWAKRIMYRSICNYIRENARYKNIYFPENLPEIDSEEQPDNLGLKFLFDIIETLPTKTKKAFSLFVEGFTHAEIAKELGMSEGTSKWHISEARVFLQKKILQNS
jgi:RNA polymerase sigma-70 factor (ECF subfamily)